MVLIILLLTLWTNVASSQTSSSELSQIPSTPPPATAPAETSPPVITNSFEQNFQEGVRLYHIKDFDKSRQSFERALESSRHSVSTLTNLGLVSYDLGKKGLALGYLRRALELDPDFSPAMAGFKFVWSQLEVKEIPHRIETYETLRENLLKSVPLASFLWLGSFCFLISGALLIHYFGRRKRAFDDELPLPPFPAVGAILSLVFLALLSLTFLKAYDLSMVRGTIVAEKATVRTAPAENETSLFELSQGLEVILRKADADWVQIIYPGGPSGWIRKNEMMTTTAGSF